MLSPFEYYSNENGVIQLIEKDKSNLWKVKWTKWPNVNYEKEPSKYISESDITSQFMKVKEITIDEKCGCVRVVC
jgi:hypothetical protein